MAEPQRYSEDSSCSTDLESGDVTEAFSRRYSRFPHRPDRMRHDSAIDVRESAVRKVSKGYNRSLLSSSNSSEDDGVDDSPACSDDVVPGCRLLGPFEMPALPHGDKRVSLISVTTVTSFVKYRSMTRDSDTPASSLASTPESESPFQDCTTPQGVAQIPWPLSSPEDVQHGSLHTNSAEERGAPTRKRCKIQLRQKCTVLETDREHFAASLQAKSEELEAKRDELERTSDELATQEQYAHALEIKARRMQREMEDCMRKYTTSVTELRQLKAYLSDWAPSVSAQVLSKRQRKINTDLKVQVRESEQRLGESMENLRDLEKAWRQTQSLLTSCTRDLYTQRDTVEGMSAALCIVEKAKEHHDRNLILAEKRLRRAREQLEQAEVTGENPE